MVATTRNAQLGDRNATVSPTKRARPKRRQAQCQNCHEHTRMASIGHGCKVVVGHSVTCPLYSPTAESAVRDERSRRARKKRKRFARWTVNPCARWRVDFDGQVAFAVCGGDSTAQDERIAKQLVAALNSARVVLPRGRR